MSSKMAQGRNPLPRAHTTDTAEKGPALAAAPSPAVTRLICREVKDNAIQRKELRFPLRTSDVVNLQGCFPLLPAPVHGSPNIQGLLWAKRPQSLTARSTHLQSSVPRLPVSPWASRSQQGLGAHSVVSPEPLRAVLCGWAAEPTLWLPFI